MQRIRPKSSQLWNKMKTMIPGGVSSPIRSCMTMGVDPIIVDRGEGAYIYDIDDNKFIDFCMSWGALFHGHANPLILEEASSAMMKGTTFGITSPYEENLASTILKMMPMLDMVRFVSTGTEATMSATRLARAYTGKKTVLKCEGHYHGHADQFLVKAGSGVLHLPQSSSSGIPEEFVAHTKTIGFNDVEGLERFLYQSNGGEELAALIIEPIAANMGVIPMTRQFMDCIETARKQFGFLLIFDEVITGFRLGVQGASRMYKTRPDLITLGKIIGGGFPAAAFGGKKEIMSLLAPIGSVYQAGTLSGNPVAMAAGKKALSMISEDQKVYQEIKKKSLHFVKPIAQYIRDKKIQASIQSVGTMWTLFFGATKVEKSSDVAKLDNALFRQYFIWMLDAGIYIPPLHNEAWFLSTAHSEKDLKMAKDATLAFFEEKMCR